MKAINNPSKGKIGTQVAYLSPFGQCYRAYVVPRDPRTIAQERRRSLFAASARAWRDWLTELQRQHWETAAQETPSHPSLGQYGHLSGQELWMKIDLTLRWIGQPSVAEPPAPVVFGPNPVNGLAIDYDSDAQVRLCLNLGPVTEDILVFGQQGCSSGRMKPRRVYYLGLVSALTEGPADISALYTAKFPQPRPNEKVFIVTSQEKNGWCGPDTVLSALVPPRPQ